MRKLVWTPQSRGKMFILSLCLFVCIDVMTSLNFSILFKHKSVYVLSLKWEVFPNNKMLTKAGMLWQWQMKMLWLMTVLSCVTGLSCWLLTSSSTISQLLKLIQHILQSSPRLVHLVELQSWILQYFYYQIDKDLHLQLYEV